jgi:hypothetical protein
MFSSGLILQKADKPSSHDGIIIPQYNGEGRAGRIPKRGLSADCEWAHLALASEQDLHR